MGTDEVARQSLNVFRMKLLGTIVRPVDSGSKTLKDAINEAMRDWITNVANTHYVLGTVYGPHPFPMIVRDFQSVIGREAKKQIQKLEGKLPDALIACVGGGSNAMGLFYEFIEDASVKMYGIEAGGLGIERGKHAARFAGRVEYTYAIDEEAMEAFDLLSRLEGIIPALESAHAVAYCLKLAPTLGKGKVIIVNLSGRGDKDVMQVAK